VNVPKARAVVLSGCGDLHTLSGVAQATPSIFFTCA
jgi:hypothetical protein